MSESGNEPVQPGSDANQPEEQVMNDGTPEAVAPEAEAESKRPKIATREYDFENAQVSSTGATVSFNFADEAKTELTFDPAELPEEMRARALLFGVGTRIRNAYASVKGDVAKAIETAREEWEQLKRGNWVERAGGDDSVAPSTKLLAECLAEVVGKPVEACMVAVQKLDKKQRAALRRDPRIDEKYQAKKPKKAPKQVDLTALLNA